MKKSFNLSFNFYALVGIFSVFLITLFILPWLGFWLSYFCGWVAKITIGKYLVAGFNYLGFPLVLDKIPLVAGTLGWIGGFFKAITTKVNTK